jgi:hypothetical protein
MHDAIAQAVASLQHVGHKQSPVTARHQPGIDAQTLQKLAHISNMFLLPPYASLGDGTVSVV